MKKWVTYTIITVLTLVTAVSVIFGITESQRAAENARFLSANYQHAFSELAESVENVDSALQKSLLVTSSSMAGAVCSELFGTVQMAEMALGVLPFSSTEMENTAGFLNKTGDYAFALSQKAYTGESFSDEDKENLRALSEVAAVMTQNLKSIQDNMDAKLMSIDEYRRTIKETDESEDEAIPQTLADSMSIAEKEFPEVPSLIYDGPFSEHLTDVSPLLLEGKEKIDKTEGRAIVAEFLGVREERVYPTAESEGDIPSYYYECQKNGSPISIWVSKVGGEVCSMLSSRYVESSKLDAQQALDKAKAFLKQKGYENMKESYYLISNNVLTANFAYVQDGVVCYSDLIKVGIALDDGSVKSFEASGYITAHHQREIPQAEISKEEAQTKVADGLTVLGVGYAMIPSAGQHEVFCYEFECQDENEQRFIVYVDALTGEQEKILILLQDENGTLTI